MSLSYEYKYENGTFFVNSGELNNSDIHDICADNINLINKDDYLSEYDYDDAIFATKIIEYDYIYI